MLSATQKDQIINNRGESRVSTSSTRVYMVETDSAKFTMVCMNKETFEEAEKTAKNKFCGDFVSLHRR